MPSLADINHILFWVLVFTLAWNAYILLFHKGVPNINTAPAIRGEIVAALKKHFGEKPFTVFDLGSGDGRLTREIACGIPAARVTGLEMSRQSLFSSNLVKRLQKIHNLAYKRADFFTYDFSAADAIVMYQSVFNMEPLGKKLDAELKPGAFVACNRFPLGGGWQPTAHLEIKTLYPHQKDLYLYVKT